MSGDQVGGRCTSRPPAAARPVQPAPLNSTSPFAAGTRSAAAQLNVFQWERYMLCQLSSSARCFDNDDNDVNIIFHKRPSRRATWEHWEWMTIDQSGMYSTKDLGADTWLGTASYWAGSLIIQAFSGTRKNPTGCFCDLYPLKSMRKSFSVGTDIPQKVPIVFKKRAGDLFMFEIK